MSAAAMSQLSCFATIQYNNNRVHPPHLLISSQKPSPRRPRRPWGNRTREEERKEQNMSWSLSLIGGDPESELSTGINSDRHAIKASSSGSKLSVKYIAKALHQDNDILVKPNPSIEEYVNGEEIDQPVEKVVTEPKRAAKIHDFCFGIPYGGIVFSGGLIDFCFTRNPATLISGGLYGSALLALSMFSLKVWRQGQSSLPFILGQAGIAVALLWKNMKTYSLTKKILPTGLNVVISAAMLCFYMYVVVSGGNPPSKKFKSAAAAPS